MKTKIIQCSKIDVALRLAKMGEDMAEEILGVTEKEDLRKHMRVPTKSVWGRLSEITLICNPI